MRRILVLIALASALAPGVAFAQSGVALRWNHCFGEGTGAMNRSFACDTNSGVETLVGSFMLPIDLAAVVGNEITVDITTSRPGAYMGYPPPGPPLPEWWKYFQSGTCRQLALSVSFVADPANVACEDWGSSQGVGLIGAYRIETAGGLGPGRARLIMAVAVPQVAQANLLAGHEYASFTVQIRHDKTVGTGACGGCEVPLYIYVNSIRVVTPAPANDLWLSGPLNGYDANFVSWNAGIVPTRGSTWAALKARYH